MTGAEDDLIDRLATDLRPVRPLAPPVLRAIVWLTAVAAIWLAVCAMSDRHAFTARMEDVPDLRWAAVGAALTAGAAAVAAFETSVPGRRPAWVLLPVPPALLWLGASGWGCTRTWQLPWMQPATVGDSTHCLLFITTASLPLSIALLLLLRRAAPLYPVRVTVLGGLAAAAAAACLLCPLHPEDVSLADLLMHAAAVAVVILANYAYGRRYWRTATN